MTRSAADIFHGARELPTSARATYLDGACGKDVALRAKVEALLKADAEAGSFLGSPASEQGARAQEQAGAQIGRYKLLEQIGEGGMGAIWMAEQREPVKRRVALKIIKLGMDTKQVIARFEAERQALAMMDHPHIAKVLDAGATETGRPYFVMEYIKGIPILEFCDQNKVDTRARLQLFTQVCHAIQHAHQKGIIHRDIKPSNVLVTLHDGVPMPKVIDFGIAKATNSALTSKTLFTEHRQMVGTPAYMSPEQAQGEIEKLDERADVFSLGAILCELLTGKPPYEAREGEPVLTQAAKAQLDPARARLEACGADPALIKLCLECLTPSKAARPSNADAVARAVHEYLTSVEERAKKAEVDAAEARVRAAEDRRARRLTVALASSIALAIALGSAGLWWVNRERTARSAQLRAAVETAQGESLSLAQSGQHGPALEAAKRALALAQTGDADEATLQRARDFLTTAESAASAAEREQRLVEQDRELQETLLQLRIEQVATLGNRPAAVALDEKFTRAFQAYGVDLEGSDLVPALERIRERDNARQVALALDDWGRVRRQVHGPKSEKSENLYVLAMDLDPDPERSRLRTAIAEQDAPTLLEFASHEKLATLDPGSIFVLSTALWAFGPEHRPEVFRIFDLAVQLYPGDFVLQSVGGNLYSDVSRFEAALACRTAALSLRPNDPRARLRSSDALYFMGRTTEAEGGYRALIAQWPQNAEAHYVLGLCRSQMGDFAQALSLLERALALQDNPDWRPDLVAAKYYAGLIGRDELVREIEQETQPEFVVTLLYPLLDHPQIARRDTAYAVQALARNAASLDTQDWAYLPRTVASIRVGDWAGAAAQLEGRYAPPTFLIINPTAMDFVRALVQAKLGNVDRARESYARGAARVEEVVGGNPDAWTNSDVARCRRESEVALGL